MGGDKGKGPCLADQMADSFILDCTCEAFVAVEPEKGTETK